MPDLTDISSLTPQFVGITGLLSQRARIVHRAPVAGSPLAYTLIALPGSYASIDEAHAIAQQMNELQLSVPAARDYVVLRRNGQDFIC
jgi:hypothetical protein